MSFSRAARVQEKSRRAVGRFDFSDGKKYQERDTSWEKQVLQQLQQKKKLMAWIGARDLSGGRMRSSHAVAETKILGERERSVRMFPIF